MINENYERGLMSGLEKIAEDNTTRNAVIGGLGVAGAVGAGIAFRKPIGKFFSKTFKGDAEKVVRNTRKRAPSKVEPAVFEKAVPEKATAVSPKVLENTKISIPALEQKRAAAISKARSQVSKKVAPKGTAAAAAVAPKSVPTSVPAVVPTSAPSAQRVSEHPLTSLKRRILTAHPVIPRPPSSILRSSGTFGSQAGSVSRPTGAYGERALAWSAPNAVVPR
jgi:hypothetical protein